MGINSNYEKKKSLKRNPTNANAQKLEVQIEPINIQQKELEYIQGKVKIRNSVERNHD